MPEKIKARLASDETYAQIAKSLKVARSSVYRVVAALRAA
jgi:predicted transcriptional regulator